MHFLYIIYSEKLNRFYVGETIDIQERIKKHNQHAYKNAFTKISDDWKVVLCKKLQNRKQALFLEKFIKRMKSKTFIYKIIDKPQILDDILLKM